MSTNSHIWMKNDDGSFTGIYCHWDGYLSYNGQILFDDYTDKEKVKGLIALGAISILAENIDCPKEHNFEHPIENYTIAYHRDRNDEFMQLHADNLDNLFMNYYKRFNYFFIDNKWFYTVKDNKELIELTQEEIDKENK